MNTRDALLEYKKGMAELEQTLPDVVREYHRFTDACFAEGALSRKEKHLIALALAVHANDEYCILYHVKGAVDQGAAEREVLEAACVSAAFGGGLAMSQTVTLVQQTLMDWRGKH
jgi:AhpD family alkylhydroperoxidase